MFRNLLIADSGKGHVEEMIRMLQDIPSFKTARVNLLHVVPEQSKAGSEGHRDNAQSMLEGAVDRMGLEPSAVQSIVRDGDTKQTVLKVADELDRDGFTRAWPPSIDPRQQHKPIRLSTLNAAHAACQRRPLRSARQSCDGDH